MSKVLIAPPQCFKPETIHDRWVLLFEFLRDEFGFELQPTTAISNHPYGDFRIGAINKDVDTVFLLIPPKFVQSDAILNLIPKNAKLITYAFDIFSTGARFEALLDRSDVILSWSGSLFRRSWPQFADRFIFLPPYFSDTRRFTRFKTNTHPKMRCLLSGAVDSDYPLRTHVWNENSKLVDILPFPGTYGALRETAVTRDAFAKLLHSYLCAITSSVHECAVCKMVEIPAVGALLLTDRIEDMDTMGFVPDKHYVPVTIDNVMERIDEVIKNPDDYKKVRTAGRTLVRKLHSFDARKAQLRGVIEGL